MKFRNRSSFIILLVICFLVSGCKNDKNSTVNHLPYFNTPAFNPQWKEELTTPIHQIADFSFTNQDGETVNTKTVEDKTYVANFFFTICPGICPVMTDNMFLIQEEFKSNENVLLLSHSITPWIDTEEKLKAYAIEKQVISGKWHLLTGKEDEIYDLARNSYFADKEIGHKAEDEDFLHTENFILIDKASRIRGVYNGTKASDIDRLIEDLYILQGEN